MRRPLLALWLTMAICLQACAATISRPDVFNLNDNAPYTLGSGDRVRIIVFGQDSITNSYAVDGSGQVSLPLIGFVRADGLTTGELEHAIEARLRNGFLREPRVAAEVEAFRPFFVLGEVTTAGQYPFVNGMTVQKAIAIAGGFTPRARQTSADITRMVGRESVTGAVPLSQPLRPGDTVIVRERFF